MRSDDALTLERLLSTRRSIRRYRDEIPDKALLERLIAAAGAAPSASNKQAWRFVVVRSRAVIERLAAAVREAVAEVSRHIEPDWRDAFEAYGAYFTRFEHAPVVIVPLYRSMTLLSNMTDVALADERRDAIARMEEQSGIVSASLAVMNLLLMAHAEGLGASGMTGPLVAGDAIRAILQVPPSWRVVAFVPLGFPDEAPHPTARRPVEHIIDWIDDA